MKRYIFILLSCLFGMIQAQERLDTLTAVVRDAETGEPVPYASVYVSPSCGTISNVEGEFSLQCLPSDVVRISSIGYAKAVYEASRLPATVRLRPVTTAMRELTVTSADDVLYRLVRKMQKEARKHRKASANYFFRLTTQYPGTDELAEAFMSAKSCVQLRDLTFHSGKRGLLKEDALGSPDLKGLGRTNTHVFLRLAPVLVNFDNWLFIFVPADFVLERRAKLYYDVSCVGYTDDDGLEIRKIHLERKKGIASPPILEGTLYVDYRNCRLLRFDGRLRGLYLRIYDNARRRESIDTLGYTMHVDYRHDHGFTEIANMSGTLLKDKVMLRFLLFGLGDRPMSFARAKRVGDNMLSAIDEVGYDSLLWTTSDIVKRTRVEERVAFGDSAFIRGERSAYNVPPSLQERDANAFLRDAMQKLKAGTMKLHRGLPTRK